MDAATFLDFSVRWGLGITCMVAAIGYLIYRNAALRNDKDELLIKIETLQNEKALLVASRRKDSD